LILLVMALFMRLLGVDRRAGHIQTRVVTAKTAAQGTFPNTRANEGSARADSAFDPSTKWLGRPDLVKQPSSKAVRGLQGHREDKVFRSGERMSSGISDVTRLVEQRLNSPGQFSHGRIMIDSLRRHSRTLAQPTAVQPVAA
jgi:hypothetical protein